MNCQKILHFGFGFFILISASVNSFLLQPADKDLDQILDNVFLVFFFWLLVSFQLSYHFLGENAHLFFIFGFFLPQLIKIIIPSYLFYLIYIFNPHHLILIGNLCHLLESVLVLMAEEIVDLGSLDFLFNCFVH